jgi:hypothetical protein
MSLILFNFGFLLKISNGRSCLAPPYLTGAYILICAARGSSTGNDDIYRSDKVYNNNFHYRYISVQTMHQTVT